MTTVVVTQGTTRTVQVATAGPQGVRGAQGWVWRGAWDVDTDYAAEVVVGGVVTVGADVVHHGGSAWLAVADSTGVEPTALAAEWELIAEKGEPTTLTVTATTLPVGEPATAVISGTAPAQAIAFGLPTGATGATGPANELTVTASTGAPGSEVVATITGTPPTQNIDFVIPSGLTGAQGDGVGTLGNLLTAARASAAVTTDFTAGNATLTEGTTNSAHGPNHIVVTATGATPSIYTYSGSLASVYTTLPQVTPGSPYTFTVTARTGVASTLTLRAYWLNADGSANSNAFGTTRSFTSASWAEFADTLVAPAGAAYVYFRCYTSHVAGESYEVDKFGVWVGAGGTWATPGTPITNTGRRVTHPATDDAVSQVWDGVLGRWQTVAADTGRRALTLANGWTATSAILRRTMAGVELVFVGLNGASATSGTVVTLDAGFRPSYAIPGGVGATAAALPTNLVTLNTNGTVVVGGTYTNVTAGSTSIRFNTDATWPATLQGTLVSAAPA